jgi:hypothetical protein
MMSRNLLKRKTWALIPVFFLLSSVTSDGLQNPSGSTHGNVGPAVSEGPAQEDRSRPSPADPDPKAGPEKSREPAPPFEDFVPTEKIDADKAVDFPVDI